MGAGSDLSVKEGKLEEEASQEDEVKNAYLKGERQTLRLWFLTFAGVVFEIIPAVPTLSATVSQLKTSGVIPFTTDLGVLVWYLIGPMLYCALLSFSFEPKRIVSPMNIQIGTVGVSAILIADSALRGQPFPSSSFIFNYGLSFGLSLLLLMVVGAVQSRFVHWIVGLNGVEGLPEVVYSVNLKYDTLVQAIDENFLYVRSLDRKVVDSDFQLLVYEDDRDENVVFGVGVDPSDGSKSLVAATAFESGYFGLMQSDGAARIGDSIIRELEREVSESNKEAVLSKVDSESSVLGRTREYALRRTRSPLGDVALILRRAHGYARWAMMLMVAALVLLTVSVAYGWVDVGAYVSSAIVVLVALVVDIGLVLREETGSNGGKT